MRVELFKDDDKRLRRRGIIHRWLKPFLLAAALIFLAVLASHGAEEAPKKADYVDPVTGMEFVLVKGGEFEIVRGPGTDFRPEPHPKDIRMRVRVSDFYIGKYEVTQAQWLKVMGKGEFRYPEANHPAEMISWDQAMEFTKRLSELSGLKYRLPSGVEWEYAARSGGKDEIWAGTSNDSELEKYALLWSTIQLNSLPILNHIRMFTAKVGSYKPNGLGIYDMTGNVYEWILDGNTAHLVGNVDDGEVKARDVGATAEKKTADVPLDPRFSYIGNNRVLRGGSFLSETDNSRNNAKHVIIREIGLNDFGLRVLLPAGEAKMTAPRISPPIKGSAAAPLAEDGVKEKIPAIWYNSEPQYPPYPERWDLVLPWDGNVNPNMDIYRCCPKHVARDDNCLGQSVILYSRKVDMFGDNSAVAYNLGNFFRGEVVSLERDSNWSFIHNNCRRYSIADYYRRIAFGNGKIVKLIYGPSDPRVHFSGRLELIDGAGNLEKNVVVLYLQDKYFSRDVNPESVYTDNDRSIVFTKVSELSGDDGYVYPLLDDTFILYSRAANVAVRFDSDLRTKSQLLGNKLFILDDEEMIRLIEKSEVDRRWDRLALQEYIYQNKSNFDEAIFPDEQLLNYDIYKYLLGTIGETK